MADDKHAVIVNGPGVQVMLQMLGDQQSILQRIETAIANAEPLRHEPFEEDHGRTAVAIWPTPGMSFAVVPWADYLAQQARAKAAAAAQQQAMGNLVRVPGARMPPANGKRGRR